MRRLAAPLAVVALLAGCGGGDDQEPGRTATVRAGATVDVTAREYSFDPETIVVEGGGTLTIRLDNAGDLAHNLRLRRGGTDVGGTPTFEGGRTESGSVQVEPGQYEMLCTVGDHAELGMIGELEVK
jgi:plastocyanin